MVHWLVLIWAVVVLVFSIVGVFLILTRRSARPGPQFFASKTEGPDARAKMGRLLELALAQSQTDAEFERQIRRLLAEDPVFETDTQWASLLGLMNNYRRSSDPLPATRLMAERLLADFPRLYGTK